ncbi:hypothetical protein AV521_28545 [Streptomyces sp. IMTB 2501]|nr:hypothetical protein AV521_28545 [Streptomyces sp. IMTB 2501]
MSDARWALIEPVFTAWWARRTGPGTAARVHDLREIVREEAKLVRWHRLKTLFSGVHLIQGGRVMPGQSTLSGGVSAVGESCVRPGESRTATALAQCQSTRFEAGALTRKNGEAQLEHQWPKHHPKRLTDPHIPQIFLITRLCSSRGEREATAQSPRTGGTPLARGTRSAQGLSTKSKPRSCRAGRPPKPHHARIGPAWQPKLVRWPELRPQRQSRPRGTGRAVTVRCSVLEQPPGWRGRFRQVPGQRRDRGPCVPMSRSQIPAEQ